MSFENATVLNYLLGNGFVYTFRKEKRKTLGKEWINAGRTLPKIADVNVTFVKEVKSTEDLRPYIHYSGFGNIFQWCQAIADLGISEVKGYLYRVSLRRV